MWLRAPEATGRALYEAAGGLLLRCRRLGAALLVGDRVDVALAVGADGVQLGARAIPPRAVRGWYPGWMGVSCHTAEEVRAAEEAGANHLVALARLRRPAEGRAPPAARGSRRCAAACALPVVAMGGIGARVGRERPRGGRGGRGRHPLAARRPRPRGRRRRPRRGRDGPVKRSGKPLLP